MPRGEEGGVLSPRQQYCQSFRPPGIVLNNLLGLFISLILLPVATWTIIQQHNDHEDSDEDEEDEDEDDGED